VRITVLTICVIGLTLLAGCAFSHGKYYYHDGTPCAHTFEGVVGTGETETVVDVKDCVKLTHSTSDTGISQNATELGGKVSEGLAKGAVKGVMPVPVP
jgi:hypothetical protein